MCMPRDTDSTLEIRASHEDTSDSAPARGPRNQPVYGLALAHNHAVNGTSDLQKIYAFFLTSELPIMAMVSRLD